MSGDLVMKIFNDSASTNGFLDFGQFGDFRS